MPSMSPSSATSWPLQKRDREQRKRRVCGLLLLPPLLFVGSPNRRGRQRGCKQAAAGPSRGDGGLERGDGGASRGLRRPAQAGRRRRQQGLVAGAAGARSGGDPSFSAPSSSSRCGRARQKRGSAQVQTGAAPSPERGSTGPGRLWKAQTGEGAAVRDRESPGLAATEEYVGAQTSDLSWLLTEILLLKAFLCKALKTSAAFTNLRIMDKLMLRFRMHLCGGGSARNAQVCRFFSAYGRDEISIEEDAERKVGWLLKIFFAGTASFIAYQFFPYMGDTLLQQSVSLLQVKDPLFKRMGASRLSRFAIDDERRMKIVEMGGAQELLNMLEAAKDDRTRKAALKALDGLARSDVAAEVLHKAGAAPIIRSTPDSSEYAEVESYKSNLLKRFRDLKLDSSSSE